MYRVCRVFTVESGHMLSKHAEKCRFPHGHTRHIEVVCSAKELDDRDMVVDFKALKLALDEFIDLFDHAMAINSKDPLLPTLQEAGPESVVVYEDQDPTTEVLAADIYWFVHDLLEKGWKGKAESGAEYVIPAKRVRVDRVRVSETPNSWAEFSKD